MQDNLSALSARKANLEKTVSVIARVPVEVTFLSLSEFTFSAEGDARTALDRVREFLAPGVVKSSAVYDAECSLSCLYVTLKS